MLFRSLRSERSEKSSKSGIVFMVYAGFGSKGNEKSGMLFFYILNRCRSVFAPAIPVVSERAGAER